MRACLVSGRVTVFEDEGADRERGLDLLVVRAAERVEALDFGLDLVMGSSEVMRRHPPHHLSPAREKSWQGKTPKRAFATSSHRSNAPIKPKSQSILSKIIAPTPLKLTSGISRKMIDLKPYRFEINQE
jgi:hypothetical protein